MPQNNDKIKKTNKYIEFLEHLGEIENLNQSYGYRFSKGLDITGVKTEIKQSKIKILELYFEVLMGGKEKKR